MVAVSHRPNAGVEESVAVAIGHDEVAIIACVGEAQEAFLGDVGKQLHVLGVVDEHAAVVGEGHAAGCALTLGDERGGCARGSGSAGAGLYVLGGLCAGGTAGGQGKGGHGAECAGSREEVLTGHVHDRILT